MRIIHKQVLLLGGQGAAAAQSIIITGSSAGAQTDYPVRVDIVFVSRMATDFHDVRFTDVNGAALSFWRESYNAGVDAIFWVKIPSIPAAPLTTTIVMTFGNHALADASDGTNVFALFDDFTHSLTGRSATAQNAAAPSINIAGLLAENIVYDDATQKYWWILEDRRGGDSSIILASADSINGTWTLESSPVIAEAGHDLTSPFLVKFGSTWHIYYGRCDTNTTVPQDIWAQTSTNVNEGYSAAGVTNPVLARGISGAWDDNRALEPFVFHDGTQYRMFYMGEKVSNLVEKVGMATSSDPVSGWTKSASNPVVPGDTGWWDAGIDKAADPWVILVDGVYYIGIAAVSSVTKAHLGQTGVFWTTDFVTFTPCHNPVLALGTSGAWDDDMALRGGIIHDNGVYYFPYTGGDGASFKPGMATIQFAEGQFVDWSLWAQNPRPKDDGNTIISTPLAYLISNASFGTNVALRTRSRMGTGDNPVVAFRATVLAGQILEFIANLTPGQIVAAQRVTADNISGQVANTDEWNVLEIARHASVSAIYSVDDVVKATLTTQLPTGNLPVCVWNGTEAEWVLVRKYVNPEPTSVVED